MSSTYRVKVNPDNSTFEITSLDIFTLEIDVSGIYMSETDLPEWVKRKLSALSFCDWEERSTNSLVGVGKRINEHVFYIYN